MASAMKQANRLAKLTTPLGEDVLVLTNVQVTEGLSELFEVTVSALSEREDIDFDAVIGQACTVELKSFQGATRYFNGLLTAAKWHGRVHIGQKPVHDYQLVLRPWLWVLGTVSDCRIFHKKSVIEIIQEVFSKREFQDFRVSTPSYPKIEYCVQYRETDLNFVRRLMEEYGIYFFFEHSNGKHTLVLADSMSSHKQVEGLAKLDYHPYEAGNRHDRQCVIDWTSGRRFKSGKTVLNDYNFETPTANLLAQKAMPGEHTRGSMELYDYPGRYPVLAEGEDLAKARIEAQRAEDRRRTASGIAPSLMPGGLIKLDEHPKTNENIEYLVVRCQHNYRAQAYSTVSSLSGGEPYSGSYEFQPSAQRFRAPTLTPKPIVYGPQTAVVTGEKGEEIDVDKYGRILVRFHWDREKGQSCRVRVAQVWSGKKWGGQVIPRIGQEVVVEFLEGDPDRPLVTGTVYNADNMPPYALPENKTMAGIKSNSTKGGGGYNEFVFEDKKGSENIRMHAEKDHEVEILDSETVKIGERFSGGGASRDHTILRGDDKLTVATGSREAAITKSETRTIGQDETTVVGMNQTTAVGMNLATQAGNVMSLSAGAAITIVAGAGIQMTASANLTIVAPTITLLGNVIVQGTFTTPPPIIKLG